MKLRKTRKKLSVLLLALVMIFTMMPVTTMTAEATSAVTGTFGFGGTLSDAYGNDYRFSGSEATFMQIYFVDYKVQDFTKGNCLELANVRSYRVNGQVAYCVEHGVDITPGIKLTARNLDQSYLEKIYRDRHLTYILDNISLCLLYGRQEESRITDLLDSPDKGGFGFRNSKYYGKNAQKYNLNDWEAATRQLVHESQQRFRDRNFQKLQNGLEYTNGLRKADGTRYPGNGKKIRESHYLNPLKGKGAEDIYNYMVYLIKNHRNISTKIAAASETKPKEVALTLAAGTKDTWRSQKFIVSENDIADLKVELNGKLASNIRLKTGQDGNNWYYQYEVKGTPKNGKVYAVKRDLPALRDMPDDMLIWECKDGNGGHVQALATGAADPIARFVTFTTKEAPEEPDEGNDRPEPEYFPAFNIPIEKEDRNAGWDGDKHTGMGDASLGASYTLERQLNGGAWEIIDRLTLDDFGTEQTFTDQPWKTAEDLTLTESGSYTHTISSGDPPKESVHCTVAPTKAEWTGSVRYRVTETRPDGRFLEPDNGIREYEASYSAVTNDRRTCVDLSENWSEIEYDIQFRVTGGDNSRNSGNGTGNITELDPSLSYGLQTYCNDCYRGKFTLSKSLENEDVFSEDKGGMAGGQKDSQKSFWKIRLESGGWENHPYLSFVREADEKSGTAVYRVVRDTSGTDNAAEAMQIGTNGDLYVYDIPYGSYIVEEYAADDESYLKEQFSLVIGEHQGSYTPTEENDNRYDYNIRDKVKTNRIKVIKTNAETGKQVRAQGTKFYVRYMGNPFKTDPTSSKNYGRLLPNAEDITADGPYTFEADENGEITIPYELEFGTYRLEEWLLPDGYFVGEYHGGGAAGNHDYGTVEEGQRKALAGHTYADLVGVYDDTGNPVKYRDKDSYKLNEVFNFYTFQVEKQETHIDGNFGQKVDKDGQITEADPAYDPDHYPYLSYYQAVGMANNMVKGKISIEKKGETLQGFQTEVKEGRTVFTPIYAAVDGLKGAIYQIYAAVDTWLNDGSDGPVIYDSQTEKELTIPKTKSTHANHLWEDIKSALSKFFTGSGDVYETGELLHPSGAKLWYLKDRGAKEDGRYTRVYVSPEQKDTRYAYSYESTTDGLKVRYDVLVTMNYQADGTAVTEVEAAKIASVENGYAVSIPVTLPNGSVGEQILDPIGNYLAKDDPLDTGTASSLSVSEKRYTYESLGGEDVDLDGNQIDLSAIGVQAYAEKDYDFYRLTAADVGVEERTLQEAEDKDGDGIIDETKGDIPEVKETKTRYEWENGAELVSRAKGDRAVLKIGSDFAVQTIGYYQGGVFVSEESMVRSDRQGNPLKSYTIPESWQEVPFTGSPDETTHHVLICKGEGAETVYQILLADGSWQLCDENGNFQKMTVQQYKVRYEQAAGDTQGFSFSWDGFMVTSKASPEDQNVATTITKPQTSIQPTIEVGAGYTYEESGNTITFTGQQPTSPLYFLSEDGIRTEMFYSGKTVKTILTLPQSAVDKNGPSIVPTLHVKEDGKDQIIDWYSALTPDQAETGGVPIPGVKWQASRLESGKTGEAERYRIEIVSNRNADDPLEITFADGYTMTMFADTAESTNGVGVLVLDNVYKTNRASLGQLVDTIITDENGKAVSKLLPLGKYIVKEIQAPSGYVTDDQSYEVELAYEDQFTPVIWQNLNLKNDVFTVEIDLTKVFETAYASGNYQPSGGALFGLYNADALESAGNDEKLKTKIEKDTLLDVLTVQENGKAKSKIKLPYGTYYVKELAAKSGYLLHDLPFYFEIGEDDAATSPPCEFGFGEDGSIEASDGVAGKIVLNRYGEAMILIEAQVRYPMPDLTMDDTVYDLCEDRSEAGLRIIAGKAVSKAEVTVKDGEERNLILPNGKTLKVKVTGNTYTYTYDGSECQFVPTVSYTGYAGTYETVFEAAKEEDLRTKTQSGTVCEAGESPNRVIFTVTHTPVTKEVLADQDTVKTVGVLDQNGSQTYQHTAAVRYQTIDGVSAIAGEILRTRGSKTVAETVTDEIFLLAGDRIALQSTSGANIVLMLDADGSLKTRICDTLAGKLEETETVKAVLDGVDQTADVIFAKSVTLARQDHAAKILQVQINTLDNLTASGIQNDAVKPDTSSTPETPRADRPEIRTLAQDSKTKDHDAAAGKHTTIWDNVFLYHVPTKQKLRLVGTIMVKSTGKPLVLDGKTVTETLDFETEKADPTIRMAFSFDATGLAGEDIVVFETLYKVIVDQDGTETLEEVAKHEDLTDEGQTIHFNPEEPEEPDTPDEPENPKPDEPQNPSEVPKTGDAANTARYLLLALLALTMLACAAYRRDLSDLSEEEQKYDEL